MKKEDFAMANKTTKNSKPATTDKSVAAKKEKENNRNNVIIIVLSVLVGLFFALWLISLFNNKASITLPDKNAAPARRAPSAREDANKNTSTGETVTVRNRAGEYQFETDRGFIVEENGERMTVYTGGKKEVPYFNVIEMENYTHQKVAQIVDGMITAHKNHYQNRLTGEPVKITMDVNGTTINGVSFAYSTEDGSKTVYVEEYIMPDRWEYDGDDDDYYVWSAISYTKDGTNTDAMKQAMATIREWDD